MIAETIIENINVMIALLIVGLGLYGKPYVAVFLKLLGNIDQQKIKDLIEVYGPGNLYAILDLETNDNIDFKAQTDMPKLIAIGKSGQLDQVYAMVSSPEFDKTQKIFNDGRISEVEEIFEAVDIDGLLKVIRSQKKLMDIQEFLEQEPTPRQKEALAAGLQKAIKT